MKEVHTFLLSICILYYPPYTFKSPTPSSCFLPVHLSFFSSLPLFSTYIPRIVYATTYLQACQTPHYPLSYVFTQVLPYTQTLTSAYAPGLIYSVA